MGFGVTELLVVLAIVLLLFGTRKLRTMGTDLGGAIKGFRKAVSGDSKDQTKDDEGQQKMDSTDQTTTSDKPD